MSSHRVRSGVVDGSLAIPGSRSITNRALVMAALADGRSILRGPLEADDTVVMRDCLRLLGITIEDEDPAEWMVHGTGGRLRRPDSTLWVGASGTTARFITAIAALVEGSVTIEGSDRMHQRPIADLADALTELGAIVDIRGENGCPPIEISGGALRGAPLVMDASRSSQFVSALAMIAPLLDGDSEIRFADDLLVSRPYVEMTLDVMTAFGGVAELQPGPVLHVRGSTGYSATDYAIEPDMSAAVYPAAAAAISSGRVEIQNIGKDSRQADRYFFDVLENMGCDVNWSEAGVEVRGPASLSPAQEDMDQAPDAAVMLAVVAAFAQGESSIVNVGNLRIKESDRLSALEEQLTAMGISAQVAADAITVVGGHPHSASIETYDDHRIAMSFAVAGVAIPGIRILDPDCVSKTWPGFFEALESITKPVAKVSGRMSLIVAIDGPGGSGKTTVSRSVGERLQLPHLDTGAYYRAATWVIVDAGVDPEESPAVIAEVARHTFDYSQGRMLVDGGDVSDVIRTDAVTRAASPVSAIPEVRRLMVQRQREWVAARGGSAVVEGRDIGTVVFPDAHLKVFLTASPEVRASRRATEQGHAEVERVVSDLERRDRIDSTRAASPLKPADDAVIIDTSELTIHEVVDQIAAQALRSADL